MKKLCPKENFLATMKEIGYVERKEATEADYKRIGFKSGLEVHQQLLTESKLFCRCPAGIYHDDDDYNAEVIRHMRPTLSELGVYDGTALMEFKTKKNIWYRINNKTACTYEVDDTPPFPIDREALEIALRISIMCKLNIVGEVHITRKQYLDGSIPTGFQRTAILGVEGEIELKNKKVRIIQLSIEEDSCREISDIGHDRVYKTDRLGMPLIETVTYPDMLTPDELAEAAEYIRFLNRSSGLVRTGIGAGREDVNVSCEGGSRVEIKGVAHNNWIPELSHNEAFRQYALLNIRSLLNRRIANHNQWKVTTREIGFADSEVSQIPAIREFLNQGYKTIAVNLPQCRGILSHFTQPGRSFAEEISDRLKVIACIEKPNMISSEEIENQPVTEEHDQAIRKFLEAGDEDAWIIFRGPADDIPTGIETIEERIILACEGVPNETRKSFEDGTTMFERVLPGRDRMYPDTDSPPIPLSNEYIESLRKKQPPEVSYRYRQFEKWGVPADTHRYLLSKNMVPLLEKIAEHPVMTEKAASTLLGHTVRNLEGKSKLHPNFSYDKIAGLFRYLAKNDINPSIAPAMIRVICENPDMEFKSVLTSIGFKKRTPEELMAPIEFLYEKFKEIRRKESEKVTVDWLMGQIRRQAAGNISLSELSKMVKERINNKK